MKLLMTSWKIPSVMMVTGSEIAVIIGLTSELTNPKNRPTNIKLTHASLGPNGAIPGTMNVAIAMAIEVRSQLSKKRMIDSFDRRAIGI